MTNESALFKELRTSINLRSDADLWMLDCNDSINLTYPSKSKDTGKLTLYDDGHEITIVVGVIFHTHIGSNFVPTFTEKKYPLSDQEVAQEVLVFVDELLNDEITIYVYSVNGQVAGGGFFYGDNYDDLPENSICYKWSGLVKIAS
jgi:hypothetical protein